MGQRRDLLREVAQLDREIAKEQSEKDGFVTLIATLNTELPALRTRLAQTNPRGEEILAAINSKKLEVKTIDQEIKTDRQSIASLQSQSQALRTRVQVAGVRVQNANNTVGAINARIAAANRAAEQGLERVQELSREISAANAQIERNQRTMDDNRRRIVQLRPARDQLAQRVNTLSRGLDSVERDIRVQENEVSRMQATVVQVAGDRDAQARQTQDIEVRDQELAGQIASLEQVIDRLISNINAAEERIAQNRSAADQAGSSVSSIIARRTQLDREIPGMNARIGQAQSDLQRADQALAQANAALNQAKQEEARALAAFQARLQKYNTELSKSQTLGSSQAQAAANPQGRSAGQAEALSLAAKNANRVGLVRAQLDGKLRGLLSGKEVGFSNGLEAGLNSAADRQEALRLGDEAGSRAATQEANETTLPETYRATLSSILSSLPKSAFLKDLVKRFDLEETIKQTREEVALWQDPARNLSVSAYAYKAPQAPVDRSSKNCSSVYKGVREFIAACDQAFDQAFVTTFGASHQSAFAARYDGAYASTYAEVFAARKNDLFQENYDLAYAPRYNEGLVEGKRRIRETSFEEGRVAGYNRTLPVARAQATALGQQQAREYVKNNAVVRSRNNFDGALSADSRAEQGKELSLTLKAANFGEKASTRGESTAVVEVLSGNARVLAKDIAVPGIGAKKKSDLAGLIKLQVADTAVPGDDIIVQVKLTHKGDAYSSKYEETLRLGTEVVANPEVGSSLDFEREPDLKGLFGYKKHDVKIKLVGLRPYVPGSYSVKLIPASADDADMLEITKDESSVGVLGRGESRDAELEYKMNKKAKGQTVSMKAVISYDGEILKEELIQVKPR
tara:strand:- start:415 stop:2988 length:2574 start_codon:yes stop_codon:yes gene_type:complete